MNESSSLAIIVAGGTGGHMYPAVAIARELLRHAAPSFEVLFVVREGDIGRDILRREQFSVAELPGQGMPRGASPAWLTFPWKIVMGFFGALPFIRQTKPRIVLGMGGYLTFPVLLAARVCGVRCMIHEQNVFPGLANRVAAHFANSVAVSFDESRPYFPSGKTWVSGLPVRQMIGTLTRQAGRAAFLLQEDPFTFLVFGGSQGAHRLNVMMLEVWRMLTGLIQGFQVIHITGENDADYLKNAYRGFSFRSAVMPYCHQMAEAYAASDVVVCRAGASTVAELISARKPAVFVPYPFASNDHQTFNAQVLSKRGLAHLIPERDLSPEIMAKTLAPYLASPETLLQARSRFQTARLPSVGLEAARRVAMFMK